MIFIYEEWRKRRYVDLSKFASKDFSELTKVADAIAQKLGGKKDQKLHSASINNPEAQSREFYAKAIGVIRGLGYSVIESKDASQAARDFISMAGAGKSDEQIKMEMQKGADFCVSLSPNIVNLTPFPLTKAFGLAYAATRIHKCGLENVVAIGDDAGDAPVFDVVGLPVAVANADAATKEFVSHKGGIITKKKSLDGVMDAMETILKKKTVEGVKGQ